MKKTIALFITILFIISSVMTLPSTQAAVSTPSQVWTYAYNTNWHGGVAASGEYVIVPVQWSGLHAVYKDTGSEAWSYSWSTGVSGSWYEKTPLIVNNVVYQMCDCLTALNLNTGNIVWRNTTVTDGTLAYGNGEIYVAREETMAGNGAPIEVFDAVTGAYLRQISVANIEPIGGFYDNGAFVFSGVNYNGSLLEARTYVFALNAVTGAQIWNCTASITDVWSYGITPPVVNAGNVYVNVYNGTVIAVDLATGALNWHYHMASGIENSWVEGTAQDNLYLTGDDTDTVYALNAADGSEAWTFNAGASTRAKIAVSDGQVFFIVEDGNFYIVDEAAGTEVWNHDFSSGSADKGAIAIDGSVFYFSDGSTIYSFAQKYTVRVTSVPDGIGGVFIVDDGATLGTPRTISTIAGEHSYLIVFDTLVYTLPGGAIQYRPFDNWTVTNSLGETTTHYGRILTLDVNQDYNISINYDPPQSTPSGTGYTPPNNNGDTNNYFPTTTPTPGSPPSIVTTITDTGAHFLNDTKNLGGEILKGNIRAIAQYPLPFLVIVLIWIALGFGVYSITRKKGKRRRRKNKH